MNGHKVDYIGFDIFRHAFEVTDIDFECYDIQFVLEMSYMKEATHSLRFERALTLLDPTLAEAVRRMDLGRAMTWAYLFKGAPGSDKARNEAIELLSGLGFTETEPLWLEWAESVAALHALACEEAQAIARRTGALTNLQVSADAVERKKRKHDEVQTLALNKVALHSLAHLPTEWRGERCRRISGRPTEHAREEGERAERLRKGKEVVALLLEADLPYANSCKAHPGDELTLLRCCRGLRAKTLSQRVSCWKPFRRHLLQSGLQPPFPQRPEPLLDYLALRAKEGAARTSAASLLAALAFLEEAGEIPEAQRLSKHPAVQNAGKEAKHQAARSEDDNRQAPPLLLRLLLALEDAVRDEARPHYHRAFAWYRLFRHWSSLRWDDTQGLVPSILERRA